MEDTTNRNDAEDTFRSFFIGLDEAYQREVIQKMQKRPPDIDIKSAKIEAFDLTKIKTESFSVVDLAKRADAKRKGTVV